MKVKDIMQTSILSVSEDTSIKEVARLIFSTGISGAPVVKNKKLAGMITEEDILSVMNPDKEKSSSKNIKDLLDTPVSSVMNKEVISSRADLEIGEAQQIMLKNNFSRIPIVDNSGNLIGIVSQGDIFRETMKDEVPGMEKERYAGFIAKHYDSMINWDERFEYEFPSLFRIFNRHNVSNILDLGVWTGVYSIGLAKEGVNVFGIDHNSIMIDVANKKRNALPESVKKKVKFDLSDFTDISSHTSEKFDAAICMGNSLPYIPGDLVKIFKEVYKVLEKDGIVILQVLNVQKILDKKGRLLNFQIQKSHESLERERLFLEYMDEQEKGRVDHNLVVFDSDGANWIYKGTTRIPIKNLNSEQVENALKEAGFKDISISGYNGDYQGDYGPISFIKPFDPKHSDWMTVVAKK